MKRSLGWWIAGAVGLLALVWLGMKGLGGEEGAPAAPEGGETARSTPDAPALAGPPATEGGAVPLDEARLEREAVEAETPAAPERTGVRILVLREEDETAVPGIRVELRVEHDEVLEGLPSEAVTDEEGLAHFTLARGTTLHGVIARAGPTTTEVYDFASRAIATGAEEEVVVRVSSGASLSGTVVDPQGIPVGGAVVQGWCTYPNVLDRDPRPAPDREVVADEAGRFTVPHLGRRFVLLARAPGMACLTLVHGEIATGTTGDGVELVLAPAERIEGRVLDPEGRPVAGAEIASVSAFGVRGGETPLPEVWTIGPPEARARSAADGSFLLEELAPFDYYWTLDHPGFQPWNEYHSPADGFLEIRLDRGLELVGRILGANGSPIAGASVRITYKARAEAETDETGQFRLGGLVEDEAAVLYVQAEGCAILVHQPQAIRADQRNWIELRLEPESPIAGRVVDLQGEGVADALIRVEGDRIVDFGSVTRTPTPTWERMHRVGETRSGEDGRFRLERLYSGTFRIEAVHPHDPELKAAETVESGVVDLVLTLDPEAVLGVTLAGRVSDSLSGEPVRSFQIKPIEIDEQGEWNLADRRSFQSEDGSFELDGLEPGLIRLWVDAEGYARADVPQREYAAGRHPIDLALDPERTLHLRVVDLHGDPFAGTWIWFADGEGENVWSESADGWNWHDVLDASGEARLWGLPASRLTLKVGSGLDGEPAEFDVDLTFQPEGVQQFEVDAVRTARLSLFLFGTPADSEIGPVALYTGTAEWRKLTKDRDDVWPLDAPEFGIRVLDASGTAKAEASGTRQEGGDWLLEWSEGGMGITSVRPTAVVMFPVPRADLRVEVRAPGHAPLDLRIPADEIAPPGEVAVPRAVFLRRGP